MDKKKDCKERNISIQLIRIMAMFMILCDHILMHVAFTDSVLIQITNSGVLIFLFISGYLYGERTISKWRNWIVERVMKICIPVWIFVIIDFIIEIIIWTNFDIRDVFIFALNLEGIFNVNAKGGGHLWFLTLITICYLLTPVLQWIKKKKLNCWVGIFVVLGVVILQVVLSYITDIGMVAGHTLSWCVIAVGVYAIGYFIGSKILSDNIGIKRLGVTTIFTIIVSLFVFAIKENFDGKIIYDRIVVYYGLCMVDFWLCTIVYWIGKYIHSNKIKLIINYFDAISYEVYIVHGLVMVLLMNRFRGSIFIAGTFIISWLAAYLLHQICKLFISNVHFVDYKQQSD